MYGSTYIFSRQFFVGWVIVSLLWAIFSFSGVTVYPIIEGRHVLVSWFKVLLGKGDHAQHAEEYDHHRQRKADSESGGESTDGAVGITTEHVYPKTM